MILILSSTWIIALLHFFSLSKSIWNLEIGIMRITWSPKTIAFFVKVKNLNRHWTSLPTPISPKGKASRFSHGWLWVYDSPRYLTMIGWSIRYVGVIWFVFHDLQLLPTRLTQQNSCYIRKFTTKHMLQLWNVIFRTHYNYLCIYLCGILWCITITCNVHHINARY